MINFVLFALPILRQNIDFIYQWHKRNDHAVVLSVQRLQLAKTFLYNLLNLEDNMTTEKFTKYERARILGARSLQISMGAPPLIELNAELLQKLSYDPLKIAEIEFEKGLVPITVRRPMPRTISQKRKTANKPLVNV